MVFSCLLLRFLAKTMSIQGSNGWNIRVKHGWNIRRKLIKSFLLQASVILTVCWVFSHVELLCHPNHRQWPRGHCQKREWTTIWIRLMQINCGSIIAFDWASNAKRARGVINVIPWVDLFPPNSSAPLPLNPTHSARSGMRSSNCK